MWNIAGWWIVPVTDALFHDDEGYACCNGALVCCCLAAGRDACYCDQTTTNTTETIACGITVPDQHQNTSTNTSIVFQEFKCVFAQTHGLTLVESQQQLCVELPHFSDQKFYSTLFRPPIS